MTPRVQKAYERHAWIVFFAIGIFFLAGIVPFLLGVDLNPGDEARIIGMTSGQLLASNPRFFDFYVLYVRLVGLLYFSIGIFTIAISAAAYRRGDRWAWYVLWYLPVFLVGVVAIVLSTGGELSGITLAFVGFAVACLFGLLLPYRNFFPKSQVAP